ncbi:MAG: DUF2281 domain-containing protein [Flavobacteriales bacterium]|jgi:hypothetical protein|nr:DUF2281 domain-containing protein [Flavobacteriales bacterium]
MSNADLFVKIESLPSELKKEVEEFIEAILKRRRIRSPKKKVLPFGKYKGMIKMSEDFDAPLDDFKEYM